MQNNDMDLVDRYREKIWRDAAQAAIDELARTRSEALLEVYTTAAGWTLEEYLEDFRRRVHAQAIVDLAVLGFPHPRLAWKQISDELHAWRDRMDAMLAAHFALVRLYMTAMSVHDRRGGGRWDWPAEDLLEAELETGITEAKARARLADLERRERSGARSAA
jgi:hypothetical protein